MDIPLQPENKRPQSSELKPQLSFDELTKLFDRFMAEGSMEQALNIGQAALNIANREFVSEDPRIVEALFNVALAALYCQKEALAEDAFEKVVSITRRSEPETAAMALLQLSDIARNNGNFDKCSQLAENCLALVNEAEILFPTSFVYLNLSLSAYLQGKEFLGEDYFRMVFEELNELPSSSLLQLTEVLLEIGQIYRRRLLPLQAVACLEGAREFVERLEQVGTSIHFQILDDLVETLTFCGDINSALNYSRQRSELAKQHSEIPAYIALNEELRIIELLGESGQHQYAKDQLRSLLQDGVARNAPLEYLAKINSLLVDQNIATSHFEDALDIIAEVQGNVTAVLAPDIQGYILSIDDYDLERARSSLWELDDETRAQNTESLQILNHFLHHRLAIVRNVLDSQSLASHVIAIRRVEQLLDPSEQNGAKAIYLMQEASAEAVATLQRSLLKVENQHNFSELSIRGHLTKMLFALEDIANAQAQFDILNAKFEHIPGLSILPKFSNAQLDRANIASALGNAGLAQEILESEIVKYALPERKISIDHQRALLALATVIQEREPERAGLLIAEAEVIEQEIIERNPGLSFAP